MGKVIFLFCSFWRKGMLLWDHKEKICMMLDVLNLAEGLLSLKRCHWISYTLFKLWIRHLKQAPSSTSSTNGKFSLLTLVHDSLSTHSIWQFVSRQCCCHTPSQTSKNDYHCSDTSLPGCRALRVTPAEQWLIGFSIWFIHFLLWYVYLS